MDACPQCGRAYGKRKRCYYCHGKPHSGEARHCPQCGKEFYAAAWQLADVERHQGRYCSRACKDQAMHLRLAKPQSRQVRTDGCVLVWAPEHPRAVRNRVMEHILVAEQRLGRPLAPGEQVRHKDGNRSNNDAANLEIRVISRGPAPTEKGRSVPCAVCGREFYATPAMLRDGRKYCSRACSGAKDRKPRTIKPCAYCGQEMALTPSHLARVFCSRQCQSLGSVTSWTLLERTYNGRPVKQDKKGYIWVWAPERARRAYGEAPSAASRGGALGGWYPEHRIVVEEALGYDLPAETHVHHKNGRKGDNRLTNLVAMGHTEHLVLSGQERLAAIALAFAELAEYRRRYGPLTDWPAAPGTSGAISSGSASAAAR